MTRNEFEIKYTQYYETLFRIAYSYVKNSWDADDVVQDVFVKLYLTRKTFKTEDNEKYYLIRLVINRSIDYIRNNKKHNLSIDNEYINNLPDTSDADKKNEEIYECVCSLKDSYKTIIVLFFYDDYSVKEIANILKISESNVTTRLSRAKKKLKEIIIERRENNGR